jgi:serine/threonine protein kinase
MEFFQVEIMGDHFDLVMELQDGNVYELARSEGFADARGLFQLGENVGRPLMHQMLQALDYLSLNDIIHRDVEPKNILYRRIDEQTYHYRLADFSKATTAPHPRHDDDTSQLRAPEVEDLDRDHPHTTKIDMWSLCVSFCGIFGFHLTYGNKVLDKHGRVHPDWIPVLEAMVVENPKNRVSAGDVLTEKFGGFGRVTDAE